MIAATTLGTSPDAHAGDEQFPPQSGAGLSETSRKILATQGRGYAGRATAGPAVGAS
jgi:hypothetical protein